MKPSPFAYTAPTSIAETLEILARYGADARILAGGQTLGPMLNMRMATPEVLVDINRVTDFQPLTIDGGRVRTGALIRQRDAYEHPGVAKVLPLLKTALRHVGHFQTRTRGTLCGSIAHADPTAELPLILLTLNGSVLLSSKRRRRTTPASDYFMGSLTTAREPDELIIAVDWPIPPKGARFSFEEVNVRHGHIAVVACAASAQVSQDGAISALQLGVTGTSDRPLQIDTDKFLGVQPDHMRQAAVVDHAQATTTYIDDLHASAAYRRHVTAWLVSRALQRVCGKSQEASG